jgi:hypothetical protein
VGGRGGGWGEESGGREVEWSVFHRVICSNAYQHGE